MQTTFLLPGAIERPPPRRGTRPASPLPSCPSLLLLASISKLRAASSSSRLLSPAAMTVRRTWDKMIGWKWGEIQTPQGSMTKACVNEASGVRGAQRMNKSQTARTNYKKSRSTEKTLSLYRVHDISMACHKCEPWNFKLTCVGPCMSHLYVGHVVRKFVRHSCVLAHAWGARYATPRYTDDKITAWCLSWGSQLKHNGQVHQDVLHALVCMFEVRWRQLLLHYPQRGSLLWGVLETIFRRPFVWENQPGNQPPHVVEGKKNTFQ